MNKSTTLISWSGYDNRDQIVNGSWIWSQMLPGLFRRYGIAQSHLDKELGASKFLQSFNLTSTVHFLARKTFLDSDDYETIEEGYKAGHGYYYMYVFKMKKVIGVCPWGYPTNEICVYFSWKEAYGDKFRITAYPFSCAYHFFLKRKKQGMTAF